MNNFFKKLIPKKEATLNQEAIMEDMSKSISKALYPKEVIEIHHEFETAADKLLEEAKAIITEASTKNVDKVNRLEISGLKLVEGYKLEKKHIPDPVVLQPVKGGYLILTAWGDEASDPLVVNEINN